MKFKEIVKPALILFVICLLTAAALAGTNFLTKDRIRQKEIENAQKAQKLVLPASVTFEEKNSYVEGKDSNGETVGYVFTTSSKGYGGEISVMTGVSADGKITGVTILSHSETPGLGANAAKDEFANQYIGKAAENGVSVTKSAPKEGEVVAVTSATISSKAVTSAVNEALETYQKIKGGV